MAVRADSGSSNTTLDRRRKRPRFSGRLTAQSTCAISRSPLYRHHFHFSQTLSLIPTPSPLPSVPPSPHRRWPFYDASRVQLALPHPHITPNFPSLEVERALILLLFLPFLPLPPFAGSIERYYAVETICLRESPARRQGERESEKAAGSHQDAGGKGCKETGLTKERTAGNGPILAARRTIS